MRAPVNMSEISDVTRSGSQNKARELMSNAMRMAGEYLQNMKSMSGGQEGIPMKTMTREKMDMDSLRNYYTSQGLVAPTNSIDPSAQIRNLSTLYKETIDPAQQDLLHKQALKLAQGAGWLKPGEDVESVSGMAQMTNAGLPDPKYQDALIQQFFENQIKQQTADTQRINAGKSSAPKEPTDTEIAKAIEAGIVNHAKGLVSGGVSIASRGLDKGKPFETSAMSPEAAVEVSKNKLQGMVGNGLSYSQYVNAMKAVYLAVGLNPPSSLGKEE